MNDIERYLDGLSAGLRVGRRERARILSEARDHLEDAVVRHEGQGEPRVSAVAHALEAFGGSVELATTFNAAAGTRAMRRGPIVAFSAGVAVVIGFLIAGITQSHSTAPANATVPTQVSFFFAALAFQVAVVAGFCAGSRALAMKRDLFTRAVDRRFVRRCSLCSAIALGLAAIGWATTMVFAFERLTDPNAFTLWCGGTIMLIAAAVGITVTSRLRVNPSDEIEDGTEPTPVLFGLGERAIGVVRRHPAASCASLAALSMVPAMSHAETTLSGALPWGLIQALSVVLGFVVLGPLLGLRSSDAMR